MLLATTGEGEDWVELRAHLHDVGWHTQPYDASTRPDNPGADMALPLLDDIDLAMLVVTRAEGAASGRAVQNLIHLNGLLQGKLGPKRVLVLVEDRVDSFLHGTGSSELTFERGNIRSRFTQIDALLGEGTAATPGRVGSALTPWLERFGIAENELAPEVWMVAGVMAVLAALAGVIGFQVFSDPVIDDEVQVVDVSDDGGSADDLVTGDATTVEGGASDATAVDGSDGAPEDGATTTIPPGGPTLTVDLGGAERGRADGLPATCVISTRSGELIPETIDCEGLGGLEASGSLGPWHNVISSVSGDPGVAGEIYIEPRPGVAEPTVVALAPPGPQDLEVHDSRYGVDRLELQFSANGQQVILEQPETLGGDRLVLTFSLDL